MWQIVHGVDWIQTMDIVRKSDRYYETNPYLGKHPSAAEVNRYMFASAVLHFLTTKYVIPSQHVAEWQLLSISLSGFAVGNNAHIGVSLKLEM